MPVIKRIIALDLGEKRIGAAVSDPLGITARGIGVITRKNIEDDIEQVEKFIEEYKAESVVVGMPLNMDGSRGDSADKVLEFCRILSDRINIPVVPYDERLSTKQGERILISFDLSRKKRKGIIDKLAAQIILESYLNRLKNL